MKTSNDKRKTKPIKRQTSNKNDERQTKTSNENDKQIFKRKQIDHRKNRQMKIENDYRKTKSANDERVC